MQKGIEPFKVFLFFLALFSILAFISVLFPDDGIRIGRNIHLHFPGIDELFSDDRPEYADISYLLDVYHDQELTDAGQLEAGDSAVDATVIVPVEDTTDGKLNIFDTMPADEDMIRGLVFPVQYPPGDDTGLNRFYDELASVDNGRGSLRIIHYGDSQIENNRISSSFRNRLQIRFGGSGTGMFPVISPVPHNASVQVIPRGNWSRFTPRERGPDNVGDNRFGLLLSWSSLNPDGDSGVDGSFTLRPTNLGYSRLRRMDELTVFFGYNSEPFTMELNSDTRTIDAELYFPADSLRIARWTLPESNSEFTVHIRGAGSPRIFSVSLDGHSGVAVDNVPMRGSSGLEFSATDPEIMGKMLDTLNVRLLLLQFGVNVVPHVVEDYSYYENSLYRQLEYFKRVDPDLNIIVVGVSDMSRRVPGGYYESYPNIELIRDAQRNAAFRAGFAFWDLYEAMGGNNSMPSWVQAEPPLAQTDYIHFTFRGSALVGDLLYNSVLAGYEMYLKERARP